MKSIRKKIEGCILKNSNKSNCFSYFDWECPPRKKEVDENGEIWFDFDLPLEKIVSGQKVNEFTELPKILEKEKETKEILSILEKYNALPLIKLVADTNWLYLYPRTLEKVGEKRLKKIADRFEFLLQEKSDEMFGKNKIRVINFTRFQKRFEREYGQAFNGIVENYEKIVPDKIKKKWENYLASHVGLPEKEKSYRKELAKKAVASYVAEGIIFDLLDKRGLFPNPFWICVDEPEFVGNTTEILRKEKGIRPFPKIFI